MRNDITVRETVKRMQSIVFDIICDIDDYCRERNITWFLSGGSVLGAIRHRGFIPWDDDGDIMLPREEYDRFLSEFSRAYEGKYGFGSLELDDTWNWQYARIWDLHSRCASENLDDRETGIYVDIFPIDGLPEGRLAQKVFYGKLRVWRALGNAALRKNYLKKEKHHTAKAILRALTSPFGGRFFAEKMDRLARKYPFQTSTWVAVSLAAHYGERETIRREKMETGIRVSFNGRELPVPVGYETYLSNLYGDYMTIPKDAELNGFSHLDHWDVSFDEAEPNVSGG